MKAVDGSIGFLLARTARSMKRALDTRLTQHNLTATQYIVLSVLCGEDGISLSQLGQRLYFDNPTITGIVDRMERDGLVERRRIADDRRVINVFLTQKGRGLIREHDDLAEEIDAQAMSGLSVKEREAFLKVVNKIWKTMNEKID
jgi:DNA-binding MarR family transcriptional regulator